MAKAVFEDGIRKAFDEILTFFKGKVVPSGGTTGQVLVKDSSTDYDVSWQTPASLSIPKATTSSLGGIIVGSGLSVSNNGTLSADQQLTVDTALSSTSENPVQNKVINTALGGKQDAITAGSGLEFSGDTLNHSNSVTAGTIGSSSASSGATVAVPYATFDAQGHIKTKGTHTHTISGAVASLLTDLDFTERAAYYSTSITNGTSAYSSASTTGWTILDFGSTYVAFGFVSASVSCSTAFGPYYIQSADRYLRLPYATANIIACIFGTAFGGASNSGVSAVLRGNNANYLPSSGSLYGLPFRFTSPTSFSTAATQKVPVMVVGRKSS